MTTLREILEELMMSDASLVWAEKAILTHIKAVAEGLNKKNLENFGTGTHCGENCGTKCQQCILWQDYNQGIADLVSACEKEVS